MADENEKQENKKTLTHEEAVEMAKLSKMRLRARAESGRLMSDTLKMLEGQKEWNQARIKKLKQYGVDPENFTNMASGMIAVHERMLCGDIKAAEFIRDTIEPVTKKVDIQASVSKWFKDEE